MGGIYGCGCKEVYIFPHITYPYSCICSFFAASLLFVNFLKCFSFLYICVYLQSFTFPSCYDVFCLSLQLPLQVLTHHLCQLPCLRHAQLSVSGRKNV